MCKNKSVYLCSWQVSVLYVLPSRTMVYLGSAMLCVGYVRQIVAVRGKRHRLATSGTNNRIKRRHVCHLYRRHPYESCMLGGRKPGANRAQGSNVERTPQREDAIVTTVSTKALFMLPWLEQTDDLYSSLSHRRPPYRRRFDGPLPGVFTPAYPHAGAPGDAIG